MTRPKALSRLTDVLFGTGGTAGIMFQPHIPLHLPGYRALMWLGVILYLRARNGRGWGVGVGLAAAVGTLLIGRSPDGLWGVAQYAVSGLLVEAAFLRWSALARRPVAVAVVGSLSLAIVGWIAPVGQGFSGGAGFSDLWWSLSTMGTAAWVHLIGYDLLFGAGAGLLASAALWFTARDRVGQPVGLRPAVP